MKGKSPNGIHYVANWKILCCAAEVSKKKKYFREEIREYF